ncbi:DUF4097 family beta strand repeat-containing protein [Bacillus massilinigeriensis]|uniref:DUF4097 family beta strand repeat-containing protein n=1 Tax=Bacillus mediterraneensis TaxID=1805474 RepID=UPI0008F8DE0B|nr:DUF4097 family beta strand repeat-containing protein [Bacillus mediterraneensis]
MTSIKKLSILALFLLVIGAVGCLFTFSQVTNMGVNKEIKSIADEVAEVEVISDNAAVEIIPTADTKTSVELLSKGVDVSQLSFSADVKGKKLKVILKDQRSFRIGLQIQSIVLKMYVPEKLYKSFSVKNDNGKVQMAELDIKSLNVQSQNGRVELNDIKSEKVEVKLANGEIDLNNVEGNLIGSSNNGKISLVTKDLDQNIHLESDNGRIAIKTDREPTNATFDVHVDNGKIDILNKYNGNAVIGKGENLVKLETNNGNIKVTK